MTFALWDVSGKVIIPGTRETAQFGPVKIGDQSRQNASVHLAYMLNEKFRRELKGDHKFSDHFALMNLQWVELARTPEGGWKLHDKLKRELKKLAEQEKSSEQAAE